MWLKCFFVCCLFWYARLTSQFKHNVYRSAFILDIYPLSKMQTFLFKGFCSPTPLLFSRPLFVEFTEALKMFLSHLLQVRVPRPRPLAVHRNVWIHLNQGLVEVSLLLLLLDFISRIFGMQDPFLV